jgi:triosephosphate isomerase
MKDLKKVSVQNMVVAYEPVWAIGTGKADDPKNAAAMAWYIKMLLGIDTKVLYGGSLKKGNAMSFLKEQGIDGALVGGASLKAGEFKHIISVAKNI